MIPRRFRDGYVPPKKKIRRTVYFTNHPKVLKRLESFAKDNNITLSATILGFCALGLMHMNAEKWERGVM